MARTLRPGDRAAGRYRLEAELGNAGSSAAWRATDETLERQVRIKFFDDAADHEVLIERAAIAAGLTHARVVRIFDSGFDDGRFFTISELLPGSLAWARLPLDPADTARLGGDVADALAYAHDRSVAHGSVHRGNVVMGEHGAKLADFALSAGALNGTRPTIAGDLVQLGELLYAVATGRDGPSYAGRPLPDHPRGLAPIVQRLRDGGYESARQASVDLRALEPPDGEPERTGARRLVVAAFGALVAAAVAGAALLAQGSGRPEPERARRGEAIAVSTVADFDPLGDGREQRSIVARIADGDSTTFWRTERYRSGPDLSATKAGVGVILDLGTETTVGGATVLLPAPGCSFELRYSPVRAADVSRWTTVGSVTRSPARAELAFDRAASRWWLLWITELTTGVPGTGSAHACGIAEVELFRA